MWRNQAFASLCLIAAAAAMAACSGAGVGAGGSASGGKSSTLPLVLDLRADPAPAWINAAVTFTVTCQSVVGNTNLSYQWTFGDGISETTTAPIDVHAYKSGASFEYSVSCVDGSQSTSIQAPAPLNVLPYDLNVVASGTCSTGLRGLGWCWQRPLPTGNDLKAISAITPLSAWAVGDFGTVLVSDDGGITWGPKFPDTPISYLSIYTADHNHVALTASDGTVWTTVDAGKNWSNTPLPPVAYNFTAATMADANDIWAVDKGTDIVHTSNGGLNWAPVSILNLPSGAQFNAISAGDADTVWSVGNQSTMQGVGAGITAHTADGTNWTAGGSPFAPGMLLDSVSVTAHSKCLAGNPTSESVWLDAVTPNSMSAASVDSAESVDAGADWSISNTGGGALIAAFDANTAWQTLPASPGIRYYGLSTLNEAFGTTTTGNLGWIFPFSRFPFYPTSPAEETVFPAIHAMDSADCYTGWAVGDRGTILVTNDSGATFSGQAAAAAPSIANNLTSMVASSAEEAFVLSIDPVYQSSLNSTTSNAITVSFQLLLTVDGGVTWLTDIEKTNTMLYSFSGPNGGATAVAQLPALSRGQIALNAKGDGVAVGPGFIISRTAEQKEWIFEPTITDDEASAVVPSGASSPTRTSWGNNVQLSEIEPKQNILPGAAYEVWKATSVSSLTAWVIDGLGDVVEQDTTPFHKSHVDNGWILVAAAAGLGVQRSQQPPPAGGNGIAAVDLSSGVTAVIVGAGGFISRSVDKGATWQPIQSPTTGDLNAIAIISDGAAAGVGWAVGAGGVIIRTTDGGMTWVTQPWSDPAVLPANVTMTAISTSDGQAALAIGQQNNCTFACSVLLNTSDGGATWTRQNFGAEQLSAAVAIDSQTGWVVGNDGAILKTVTGGVAPPGL